jgi:AraC-like DNA-binding protein
VKIDPHLHAAGQQENARLWRAEAFGGLELFHGRFAEFSFAPHAHEEFFIVVTESGNALPRFWRGTQQVRPGHVFALNPDVVHSGGPAKDSIWCYRSMYPSVELMQRVVAELTDVERGIPHFAEAVIADSTTSALLLGAHAALDRPDTALAHEVYLLEALAVLVSRHAIDYHSTMRIGKDHRAVKRAREYLDALPAENVSLDTLAQEAGISAFRLCRVFRSETGLSPHTYQVLVRARFAKKLLAQGLPISRVAAEVGFFDQAHLTKHFKRIFGVTPGKYADNMSGHQRYEVPRE